MSSTSPTISLLERVDLGAIPLPNDKIRECEFFLGMAKGEKDRDPFRWYVSAFLNAAYSALEIKAKSLFYAFFDPERDDYWPDDEALAVLSRYVRAFQLKNKEGFVKTSAVDTLLTKLYSHRNSNTHDYALAISTRGSDLPNDYCFGYIPGEGPRVIEFCEQVLEIFRAIEQELSARPR